MFLGRIVKAILMILSVLDLRLKAEWCTNTKADELVKLADQRNFRCHYCTTNCCCNGDGPLRTDPLSEKSLYFHIITKRSEGQKMKRVVKWVVEIMPYDFYTELRRKNWKCNAAVLASIEFCEDIKECHLNRTKREVVAYLRVFFNHIYIFGQTALTVGSHPQLDYVYNQKVQNGRVGTNSTYDLWFKDTSGNKETYGIWRKTPK